jgi:hypothetical protein
MSPCARIMLISLPSCDAMHPSESSTGDRSGRVEVLPNGQHRWVSSSAPLTDSSAAPVPTLGYQTPPARRGRWWAALLGFVLGAPLGAVGIAGAIASLWSIRFKSTPAPATFIASVFTILASGFFLHAKRTFLGWLAFGAGTGLFVAGFFMFMFWGWRDC